MKWLHDSSAIQSFKVRKPDIAAVKELSEYVLLVLANSAPGWQWEIFQSHSNCWQQV